jgi:hypothetical protein
MAGGASDSPKGDHAVVIHPGHGTLGVVDEGEGHADDEKAAGDGGSDTEMGEVDASALEDAALEDETINDSHYQRGKRFRRLHRLMSSPLVCVRSLCGLQDENFKG